MPGSRSTIRPAGWECRTRRHRTLFPYFQVSNLEELRERIDDDVEPVELPYHSPVSNAIYTAFDFSKKGAAPVKERTLTTPGCFEDCDDPSAVEAFPWPNPEDYISRDECRDVAERAQKGKAVTGILWSAHFQDTCAAFGMESALMTMLTDPEMYQAVDAKIVDFYLRANEIFYEAVRGKLHAVLIGNDMGSQQGLMVSPELIRRFVIPGARKLVAQAKSYDLKVIYHSCGAISDIIPDLIEIGVDVVHPIQALAVGMQPGRLKELYGGRVSFCGGVDAQNLMVSGSPQQVKDTVHELRRLFPTGLILSPSHEAILPDTKPENVKALFEAVHEIG